MTKCNRIPLRVVRRCLKMKAELLTDEAVRQERIWDYGRLILGLEHEPARRKRVWRRTWKVGDR